MGGVKILPGTGRGTARSAVEGAHAGGVVRSSESFSYARRWAPSTMLRMVPLPVPGRI